MVLNGRGRVLGFSTVADSIKTIDFIGVFALGAGFYTLRYLLWRRLHLHFAFPYPTVARSSFTTQVVRLQWVTK